MPEKDVGTLGAVPRILGKCAQSAETGWWHLGCSCQGSFFERLPIVPSEGNKKGPKQDLCTSLTWALFSGPEAGHTRHALALDQTMGTDLQKYKTHWPL